MKIVMNKDEVWQTTNGATASEPEDANAMGNRKIMEAKRVRQRRFYSATTIQLIHNEIKSKHLSEERGVPAHDCAAHSAALYTATVTAKRGAGDRGFFYIRIH